MRVLQIVHGYPPEFIAGTERYVEALSRTLVECGHQCFVLAGTGHTDSSPGLSTVEQNGVAVTRFVGTCRRIDCWDEYYNPEGEIAIRRYLEQLRPDLVHLHHWLRLTGNLVAICKDLGLPVVVTLHDLWTTCARIHRVVTGGIFCSERPSPAVCTPCVSRLPWQSNEEIAAELLLRQELVNREVELADQLIAPSIAHKSLLEEMWQLPHGQIYVLPHGTIARSAPSISRDVFDYPNKYLRIGSWGYLTPEKGIHVLLEAISHLQNLPCIEAHIFGMAENPAYEQRLRAIARDLPVTFHGSYSHADLDQRKLDVAVFPSLCHESYSFALDEAFQLRLPVIVSHRGAMSDRIGEAGLTFPAGDAAALADRIRSLVDDPGLLMNLKSANHDPILSMKEHIKTLEEHYREVASSSKSRSIPPIDYLRRLAHKHRQVSQRDVLLRQPQRKLLLNHIREVVRTVLPNDATVIVVSKGDDELLGLDGRQGWHFPQADGGRYLGYYPADSAAAITHLESLRSKGGDFLLFPSTALWWLEYYVDFRQHLDTCYQRIWNDNHCTIYQLSMRGAR